MLLEHNDRVGKKIAISGGGRCNFTNLGAAPDNYLSANPDFCKSALARYTPWDFVALVEKHGIAYHEKKLGQQFCDGSSRAIIDMLLAECAAAGVDIRVNCRVESSRKAGALPARDESRHRSRARRSSSPRGGLSFPKLGATDFGYRVARQFGLRITELRPGLVPLTFAAGRSRRCRSLSGLSLPVVARHRRRRRSRRICSSPIAASAGRRSCRSPPTGARARRCEFDLLPGPMRSLGNPTRDADRDLAALLSRHWPRRFAEAWCARHAPAKTARALQGA